MNRLNWRARVRCFVLVQPALVVLLTAGCTPYHSTFMCEKSTNYGKCSDINEAYRAAVNNEKLTTGDGKSEKQAARNVASDSERGYRDAQYRELSALIQDPVTPMVKLPTTLRTLLLPYQTGTGASHTLYMPRYIFYFANQPQFVFGDYLKPTATTDVRTVFPTGKPAAPTN